MAWQKDYGKSAKAAADEALLQAQRAEEAVVSVDDAIAEVDVVVAGNAMRFLPAVATVALRDSTYTAPLNGDTVRVTGTSTTYRFATGSGWVVTDVYNATAIDNVTAQLADKRSKGIKITNADLDTSTDANKIKVINLSDEVKQAMAGTTPINASVADGGIGTTKLADSSVTSVKRTALGEQGKVVIYDTVKPFINFDFVAKTVTIPANTSVAWRKAEYNSPTEVVLNMDLNATMQLLYFNTSTKAFKCISKLNFAGVSESEILIALFNKDVASSVVCDAPFGVNGVQGNHQGKELMFQCFDGNYVDFRFSDLQIVIPYDTNILVGNMKYTVPSKTTVSMPIDRSLLMLYFDIASKTFTCRHSGNVANALNSEVLMAVCNLNAKKVSCNGSYAIEGTTVLSNFELNTVNDNVMVSAHRGYNLNVPENTLPAFRRAKNEGYAFIEFDVRFTSDNVPVIIHDPTINRTARNVDGTTIANTINIADITYTNALTYDFGIWKGAQYAGTKIPTLDETLKLCRMLNVRPYLHVNVANQSQLTDIYNTVKRRGLKRKTVWIMNGIANSNALLILDSKAKVGVSTPITTAEIDAVANLKNTWDNEDIFIDTDYASMTQTLIDYCRKRCVRF